MNILAAVQPLPFSLTSFVMSSSGIPFCPHHLFLHGLTQASIRICWKDAGVCHRGSGCGNTPRPQKRPKDQQQTLCPSLFWDHTFLSISACQLSLSLCERGSTGPASPGSMWLPDLNVHLTLEESLLALHPREVISSIRIQLMSLGSVTVTGTVHRSGSSVE